MCLKQKEERRRKRKIDEGKGTLDGTSCCSSFLGWKKQQLWQLWVEKASLSLLTSYQPFCLWNSSCLTNRVGSVAGQLGLSLTH